MAETILIVDDELTLLDSLAQGLNIKGYEVMKADNGKDAIEIAVKNKPDIILLDIVLPDISGAEVARVLQKNRATKNIPIIFLTGLLTKGESNADIGGKAFISKPYTLEEVVNEIERQLKKNNGNKK
jgi:DNA-binding response OmpR family regulator